MKKLILISIIFYSLFLFSNSASAEDPVEALRAHGASITTVFKGYLESQLPKQTLQVG